MYLRRACNLLVLHAQRYIRRLVTLSDQALTPTKLQFSIRRKRCETPSNDRSVIIGKMDCDEFGMG